MTYTQQLIGKRAGLAANAGVLTEAPVDIVLGNDITAPVAIAEFNKLGVNDVFDRTKIALIPDHFTPNKDIESAGLCRIMREFAESKGILHYYEVGRSGIEHCFLPEAGIVKPYDIIIGADSHTCTYGALGAFSTGVGSTDMACAMASGKTWFKIPEALRFELKGSLGAYVTGKDVILKIIGEIGVEGASYMSMEFFGEGVLNLTMDDRFTIANMVIEAGAKNGYFPPDAITREYCAEVGVSCGEPAEIFFERPQESDYKESYTINLMEIPLLVAKPHSPANVVPASDLHGIRIDQVVIGSCTNGRLSDLRLAASVLKGNKVAKNVRCIVIPGTQKVYLDAVREGIIETFAEAGAAVSVPTCGPCLGGHMGILAANERVVATTNRNFKGRMGDPMSEVYLSGTAVAAASAIAGEIACPQK